MKCSIASIDKEARDDLQGADRASRQWCALPRSFYDRPTCAVAADLLGRLLVCTADGRSRCGRIVETEAYIGAGDLACHASRGRTRRTEVMFGPPGIAYVYLIYGMYHCLNAVTEREDVPAAVLIRAVEPLAGLRGRTDGPGRLCRAFGIDRSFNGEDLTGGRLFVASGDRSLDHPPDAGAIVTGRRVGVDYAGEWAQRPWRFLLKGSRWVSRPAGHET